MLFTSKTDTEKTAPSDEIKLLKQACLDGDEKTIEGLIKKEPHLLTSSFSDHDNQTPLHFAASGHLASVRLVLQLLRKKGENLSLKILKTPDKKGRLPVDIALENKNEQTSRELMAAMGPSITEAASTIKKFPELLYSLAKKASEEKQSWADVLLGCFYLNGIGIEKDEKNAATLFLKVAKQSDHMAQALIGICYHYGAGVNKDNKEAFTWFLKSAEQGNDVAQYNLAVFYDKGWGVSINQAKAVVWHQKAAYQGNKDSQHSLALCYLHGEGIDKDEKKATKWLLKSAEEGYLRSQLLLAHCYMKGIGITEDVSQAGEWYQRAANQGDSCAQYNLAVLFISERIKSEQPWKNALPWLSKAAEQGDRDAQFRLGHCYHIGKEGEISPDLQKAIKWYGKAAEQGHSEAQNLLGLQYLNSNEVKDLKEAIRWFCIAADQENPMAQYNLYFAYARGVGVEKDLKKASEYLYKSAQGGYCLAQMKLGEEYASENQIENAMIWYQKATDQGDENAATKLMQLKKNHPKIAPSILLSQNKHRLMGSSPQAAAPPVVPASEHKP
jgi:TPR repeat protein